MLEFQNAIKVAVRNGAQAWKCICMLTKFILLFQVYVNCYVSYYYCCYYYYYYCYYYYLFIYLFIYTITYICMCKYTLLSMKEIIW